MRQNSKDDRDDKQEDPLDGLALLLTMNNQLIEEVKKANLTIAVTDQLLEEIRDKLHKYTDALRDFEFIHTNRWNTHFVKNIAASRVDNGKGSRLHAALIEEHGLVVDELHRSFFHDSDLLGSFDHNLLRQDTTASKSLGTKRALEVEGETRQEQARAQLRRFSFAIIGGLIIVVPMLILLIGSASIKTLVVISAAIFIFAACIATFSKMEPEYLLTATAGYAAVLVSITNGYQ
ncbi:hypothetical protein F5Y16DRAFT_400391 [Xylariaceae sp. FL0255]|nr:hypothetical protein F5Y16DRAFT_400391 [Xylariaceae sp. FL0255]